jgi:dTMP kinase
MALMFASRAQLIAEVIEPALAAGKWVLCDRFTDSTEAYQGSGRQLGTKAVLELHRILCRDLWPELTILMDSDVSSSVKRARRRNKGAEHDENRFEQENLAFFTRVRQGFLAIAEREPRRVVKIDARPPIETVHAAIMGVVQSKLVVGSG